MRGVRHYGGTVMRLSDWTKCLAIAGTVVVGGISIPHQQAIGETAGWKHAKNVADDVIYEGHSHTFYCGCVFTSDEDDNGSGAVEHGACGYVGPGTHSHRAERLEWEHVVPASLMPVRQFDCWENGSRKQCEEEGPQGQGMIFDLHNLVPSIGQVNALRGNDRYDDLASDVSDFGACQIEDVRVRRLKLSPRAKREGHFTAEHTFF